ncbi:MAG: ABC-F family ATP-binding cassette domain-containing protein [Desulfobacterium sp.]|nr:ABC-F family ATP-binding cassette domain-containing protein [Desulfobacterium sp.]
MINIESISKGFGGQELFSNTGLQINPGEKIGLVGRNGHGKTTLLRMITGREEPESGAIRIPGDYRLGYLTQHINFSQATVLDECMQGLNEHERDHSWKAEKILAGLGFSPENLQQSPDSFSGGFQVRLTLAKVLVSEPDLLILDEPTNYLDITSIRWISGFLRSWPREILLVTHDQSFMDSVVTHIAGIHRKVIRKIAGTTDKYYEQILQDEEVYEKTRLNDEKRRREMELFITRFRAKARLAGMVQSRVKTLAKMEKHESLSQMESLAFSFRNLPFAGKQVMQVEAVGFAHDPKVPLIEDFNLTVTPGDRIAIVGKNGKGKTTLLKILARKLAPVSGKVSYNPGIEMGYFEQTNVESLNPTSTVEEEILFSHPDLDRQQARNICGAIMFEGDNALKRISVLSGGEKSRVMLGKLLAKPLNLVLLDEPTNHLDMESCDSLVNALDNFEGAVLLVTHNEMFLHSLANRLIVFKNDAIMVFEGSYQEFLDKEGWDEETVVPRAVAENVDNGPKMSKKEMRKVRSDIISERSRLTGPLKKKVEGLEKEIEEHEEALGRLNVEIQAAVDMNQGGKISEISCAIGEHQTKIDDLFEDLERFSDELDEKMRQFDERLKELES